MFTNISQLTEKLTYGGMIELYDQLEFVNLTIDTTVNPFLHMQLSQIDFS